MVIVPQRAFTDFVRQRYSDPASVSRVDDSWRVRDNHAVIIAQAASAYNLVLKDKLIPGRAWIHFLYLWQDDFETRIHKDCLSRREKNRPPFVLDFFKKEGKQFRFKMLAIDIQLIAVFQSVGLELSEKADRVSPIKSALYERFDVRSGITRVRHLGGKVLVFNVKSRLEHGKLISPQRGFYHTKAFSEALLTGILT
jgi:hypothetical protein